MIKETAIICIENSPAYQFSKIGGKPYSIDYDIVIPKDQYGNDMFLMCQIDCRELIQTSILPKQGLLQIFITEIENTVFGSGDSKSNEDFCIHYIPEEKINRSKELSFNDNGSIAIQFIEKLVTPMSTTYDFESTYGSNSFDIGISDEYDEGLHDIYKKYQTFNILGGFPLGEDIRFEVKKYQDYELLIQLEFINDQRLHRCGDFYNTAIFIKKGNLKKGDFSDCFINFYT